LVTCGKPPGENEQSCACEPLYSQPFTIARDWVAPRQSFCHRRAPPRRGRRIHLDAGDSAALTGDHPEADDLLVIQRVVELQHATGRKQQRIAGIEHGQHAAHRR